MLAFRSQLDKAHVALVYLIVVLGGSAAGGRLLGLTLAGSAFFLFDYFFLTPYTTLVVANPLDWLVLVAFLLTSVIAAQLLTSAQQRADAARARTAEVERLAALGAETLNAVRANDALRAIAEVIRSALTVDRCDIYLRRPADNSLVLAAHAGAEGGAPAADSASLLAWVSSQGAPAAQRADGTLRVGSSGPPLLANGSAAPPLEQLVPWPEPAEMSVLALPLRVREETVGVLRLEQQSGIGFERDQRDFLSALAYYAALGAERVRLASEAEHAEALREADRLKNALLAAVSHDLRTPLTTVKALAHAIAHDGAAIGDERAISIEEEADRLTRLVSDLLDLSRLTGGAIRMRLELNTLEDLIGAAVQRTSGVLAGRPVHIEREPGAPIVVGRFDFVHALRALVNLIENAGKYSPAHSPLTLRADRRGSRVIVAVGDRGPGVPPGERERIFEPFYRASGATPDVRGAGLGLAIARGLAQAQGGDVRYNARDGGGSEFALELLAAEASVEAGT
jgi:two-component system sensor histidine kinase KdpD